MSRMCRRFLTSLILLAVSAAPALAQVQTGSIFVKAVDEQGGAVPGAALTLTSPVLPQALTGMTDSTGVHRFVSLGLGTYTLRIVLSGFQTVNRENVQVLQGQTATIEVSLKVSTLAEEITVRAESPVVDAKSANISVNIDKNLLQTTPGGKDIWSILEYKAPGVVFDTPDVGGNQGGLQRALTARGTTNAQNTQMLNGVNVNDPAAQGFSMNYYIPSAFENIQVSTGAQDITVGTGGVFINMVSKSGTNRFKGLTLQTYQGQETQGDNIDETLKRLGFRPEAAAVDYISNSNFQAGGPLVANKLFYFGSLNYQATHVNVPGFPSIPPAGFTVLLGNTSDQDTTNILAGEGKVTFQPTAMDRFEGYLSKQRYDKPNRQIGTGINQDSSSKELDTFLVTQLSWNRVISDRMFSDVKVSYNNTHFPLLQKTDGQALTDTSTNVLLRNRTNSALMFRRRLQVVANGNYFIPDLLGGRHELKFGFDNGYTPEDVTTRRVGDVNLTFTSLPTAVARTVQIFNSPNFVKRAVMSTALYAQDSFSRGRFTVTAGIRWERIEGFLPPQQRENSFYFPEGLVFRNVTIGGVVQDYTVRNTFDEVRENPLWYNFAPRMHATYDLSGRGRTVLKFSLGKYLDQINTGTPPNPNGVISQTYVWNDLNGDFVFQPGNAVWNAATNRYVGGEFGAQQGNTAFPAVATFDRSLRRPWRKEVTVGLDHELMPNLLGSVDYIYRREKDIQGQVDDNFELWDSLFAPIQVVEPGRDGLSGTTDDQILTVYNQRVSGQGSASRTVNDDRLARRYNGLEFTVTKRYSDGWTVLGGYSFSKEKVDTFSLANPNAALVNADGVSGGRTHNLKLTGSYMLPYNVLFGANFSAQSGLPITRTVQISGCSTTITTNCLLQGNTTVNAESRGSVELPALVRLDVRAGRYFDLGGNRLELSVDFYNVTNANTTFAVRTATGVTNVRYANDPTQPVTSITSFLSPTGVLGPRIIRFNVTYEFGAR